MQSPPSPSWPALTRANRIRTRWWWHGSAVDEANLTRELEALRAAGFGGVEVTPIYEVQGEENRRVPFLSDRWFALMRHACDEAARLDMDVDVVPGSGWRLGGARVPEAHRACDLVDRPAEPGSNTPAELAIAPNDEKVKRPGPGGEGYTIDVFDAEAVAAFIGDFNRRFFKHIPARLIRTEFHDSWEYEGSGSRNLFATFIGRRGYDLQAYADAFQPGFGSLEPDVSHRVLHDYRLTLEEMALEHFLGTWNASCHAHGILTRNQAHGSPGNILDLYAASDIPETEIFLDAIHPLVQKFASSAGHVAGRRLISAESFTWLSNHWQSDLAKIKRYADRLFLAGTNQIVCHGTAYSPDDAVWPGWLFYASSQINDRNPIWRDFPALADYINRCQSLLQAGEPDEAVLLYWPLPDHSMRTGGKLLRYRINGADWTQGDALERTGLALHDAGVLFDFVSDRQLQAACAEGGRILCPGASYRVVVLPPLHFLPLETAQALLALLRGGAQIICCSPPQDWDVPGLSNLTARREAMREVVRDLVAHPGLIVTNDPTPFLKHLPHGVEPLARGSGLRCLRRRMDDGALQYFLVNTGEAVFVGPVQFTAPGRHALIRDPWSGRVGAADIPNGGLPLRLEPDETRFVTVSDTPVPGDAWVECEPAPAPHVRLEGPWDLRFVTGGPVLPPPMQIDRLESLSHLGQEDLARFAGTIRYEHSFNLMASVSADLVLELGEVQRSARVFLNDVELGLSIQPPHRHRLPAAYLKAGENRLAIEVTTLAVNRIRDLDRRGVDWKIFKDINFVDDDYKPFDASTWPVAPIGLLGPVKMIAARLATTLALLVGACATATPIEEHDTLMKLGALLKTP